ncbi:MAG TPA: hypothetical protein VHD90_09545 [Phototrophicaceae bacterium]|nr:hypothetical protein [Phototrophicaceae bacterium]
MLRRLLLVLGLLLLMGNLQVASAHDVLQGDQCTVAQGDRIEGNVFVLCRSLIVNGEIDGDLIGGGFSIQINGQVDGSVYLIGGQLDVYGKIGKDVHFAGGALDIKPGAQLLDDRSGLISLSLSTQVDNAEVPGSVTSVSYQLVINGAVQREVSFWGSALTINNTVHGDVNAQVGDPASTGVTELSTLLSFLPFDVTLVKPGLIVTADGMVDGQLAYTGPAAGTITARLPHEPQFTQVTSQPDFITPEKSLGDSLRDYLAQAIREFVGLMLIGVIGLLIMRRTLQTPIYSLRVRPLSSLGVGLLAFIVSISVFLILVPLLGALVVLLFTLLQLGDLALISSVIVFLLDLGGGGAFYFIAIFISRVIVCIALGRGLTRLFVGNRSETYMTYASLAAGAVFLALVSSLPYVGLIVNALAAFFGLGAILTLLQEQLENRSTPPLAAPTLPEQARQLPPPIIEDRALGPGMDNLPEGFHWWK